MKSALALLTVCCVALLTWGCSDHLASVNENPNAPERVEEPSLLLTQASLTASRTVTSDAYENGNLAGQYKSKSRFTSFELLQWGGNSSTWRSLYRNLRDLSNVRTFGHEGYEAVATVLEVWTISLLTDLYGDIPYTEATQGQASQNFTPQFDNQEEIYSDLLLRLEEVNEAFADGLPNIAGDIIYGGDLSGWQRFANSLRLRLLMRLSEVAPTIAAQGVAEIIADPAKYPLITSHAESATLAYAQQQPDEHPWLNRDAAIDALALSDRLDTILQELDDPRREAWFLPTDATGEIESIPHGLNESNSSGLPGSNYNRELLFLERSEGILLDYTEVAFILAEAAHRGWTDANAEALFEEAVSSSFDYWGLVTPTDYFDRAGYDGTLERVITQKWIALMGRDYQGWHEWVRTGYPSFISPGPDAVISEYPRRFEYPSEEFDLNAANAQEATSRLSNGNTLLSRKWWDAR